VDNGFDAIMYFFGQFFCRVERCGFKKGQYVFSFYGPTLRDLAHIFGDKSRHDPGWNRENHSGDGSFFQIFHGIEFVANRLCPLGFFLEIFPIFGHGYIESDELFPVRGLYGGDDIRSGEYIVRITCHLHFRIDAVRSEHLEYEAPRHEFDEIFYGIIGIITKLHKQSSSLGSDFPSGSIVRANFRFEIVPTLDILGSKFLC